jgi:hypothetical protein
MMKKEKSSAMGKMIRMNKELIYKTTKEFMQMMMQGKNTNVQRLELILNLKTSARDLLKCMKRGKYGRNK